MKKYKNPLYFLIIAFIVVAGLVGWKNSAQATATDDCVPSDAWTETIEHPAVTHEETVEGTPDLWWNWSPNHQQGPFDGPPAFPVDERGTWQGPHENGGPSPDTYGTFQQGNGHGSWFHREHGTPDTVTTVIDEEAWTEYIEHPAVECPDDPTDPPTDDPTDTPTTDPEDPLEPEDTDWRWFRTCISQTEVKVTHQEYLEGSWQDVKVEFLPALPRDGCSVKNPDRVYSPEEGM